MIWQKFLGYLGLRRSTVTSGGNINLKLMHGINRISILLFLFAIAVMVWRAIF